MTKWYIEYAFLFLPLAFKKPQDGIPGRGGAKQQQGSIRQSVEEQEATQPGDCDPT